MVCAIAGRTRPKARASRASLPQIAQGVRRRTDFEFWTGVSVVGTCGSVPCSLMVRSRSTDVARAHVPEKWIPVFRKGHAPIQEALIVARCDRSKHLLVHVST